LLQLQIVAKGTTSGDDSAAVDGEDGNPTTTTKKGKRRRKRRRGIRTSIDGNEGVIDDGMGNGEKKLIQIYGPVGLYNYLAMSLSLSGTKLHYIKIQVHELHGGFAPWKHPGAMRQYGEFRLSGLERRTVPQNRDGTWTIESANEITSPVQAIESHDSRPTGTRIAAAEVQHVPKLQCFGYVFKEPETQPMSLDKDKALEMGIRPGSKYRILKCGFPVMTDDGSREVHPDEVCIGGRPAPRSVAVLGDCNNVPPPMADLCRDVDVLIHEATIGSDTDAGDKVDYGGHSTPGMAGRFADHVNAKVLLLNHLSATAIFRDAELELMQEAERNVRGRTRVQVAYDHLEILVPRRGFPW